MIPKNDSKKNIPYTQIKIVRRSDRVNQMIAQQYRSLLKIFESKRKREGMSYFCEKRIICKRFSLYFVVCLYEDDYLCLAFPEDFGNHTIYLRFLELDANFLKESNFWK